VPDRVEDDARDMVVGERVLDLAGLTAGGDDTRAAQYAQVLGDQGLADPRAATSSCTRLPPEASSRTMPSRTGDASALSSSRKQDAIAIP
jgi:hypothetical protein